MIVGSGISSKRFDSGTKCGLSSKLPTVAYVAQFLFPRLPKFLLTRIWRSVSHRLLMLFHDPNHHLNAQKQNKNSTTQEVASRTTSTAVVHKTIDALNAVLHIARQPHQNRISILGQCAQPLDHVSKHPMHNLQPLI